MRPQILLLVTTILLAGCVGKNIPSSLDQPDSDSLRHLPPQLQVGHMSFDKLLGTYDLLNNQQKLIALQYFLLREKPGKREKSEASYMLGRLCQQSSDPNQPPYSSGPISAEQTIALFDQAQAYSPLKLRSLWHKSEVAASLGKEKLVRQSLGDILAEVKDQASIAAAQYGLAQSFLRANELERAASQFKQIRVEFPHTDYAFGSGYYLGTLAYTRLKKEIAMGQSWNPVLYRTTCIYYFEYLQASPSGHFAKDILSVLEHSTGHAEHHWSPNSSQLAVLANAYFTNGQYKQALFCWHKAGQEKHLLPIALCLIRLGQISSAREMLLKALEKKPNYSDYLALANQLSLHLSKPERPLNFGKNSSSLNFLLEMKCSGKWLQDLVRLKL